MSNVNHSNINAPKAPTSATNTTYNVTSPIHLIVEDLSDQRQHKDWLDDSKDDDSSYISPT